MAGGALSHETSRVPTWRWASGTFCSASKALAPAQRARPRPHAQQPRRSAGDDRVGRHVLGHDAAGADDGVVADGDAAQEARAVADPHVVADADVALVDALQPDGALDLDDAVV